MAKVLHVDMFVIDAAMQYYPYGSKTNISSDKLRMWTYTYTLI